MISVVLGEALNLVIADLSTIIDVEILKRRH
jgi:hypothetical protein